MPPGVGKCGSLISESIYSEMRSDRVGPGKRFRVFLGATHTGELYAAEAVTVPVGNSLGFFKGKHILEFGLMIRQGKAAFPLNFKMFAPDIKEFIHQLKFSIFILLNVRSNSKYVNVCICLNMMYLCEI